MVNRNEFDSMMQQAELISRFYCTDEENERYAAMLKNGQPLPEGVRATIDNLNKKVFCIKTLKTDLTEEEQKQYILLKLMVDIQSMKNCMIFFTVLTIISLIGVIFVSCNIRL